MKCSPNRPFPGWVPLLISVCLFIGITPSPGITAPIAEKGIIDLSTWISSTDDVLRLRGEWEFYWKEFIHPDEFSSEVLSELRDFAHVPGAWDQSKYGHATYRLRILHADVRFPRVVHTLRAIRLQTLGQRTINGGKR